MLHGMSFRTVLPVAALAALATSLTPAGAYAKDKDGGQREAARLSCIGAFGDHDHFDWVPRMGLENALSACQFAIGWYPDDPELQLYNAIARDQIAERGGTQQDNLYATENYRRLAAGGLQLAEYTLSTMFDEESGVSTEDALATMERARAGEFGTSIRCEALRTFGLVNLDGNGPSYDIAAAEAMAYGNYICAGYLAGMFWNDYATPADLPLPVSDYARYAAVHGDPVAMTMVGLAYAYGGDSAELDPKLRGQFSLRQDAERGGNWLLLAHWGTRSAWRADVHENSWEYGYLQSPPLVTAMQTAMAKLGLYYGAINGSFDEATRVALVAFEASDIDALFQSVRAKEKYDAALGAREAMHIAGAALAAGD